MVNVFSLRSNQDFVKNTCYERDYKLFTLPEIAHIRRWTGWMEKLLNRDLRGSYGSTELGEQWYSMSKEDYTGNTQIGSIFVEVEDNGKRSLCYWCEFRQKVFQSDTIDGVLEAQTISDDYSKFLKYNSNLNVEVSNNVIEFIS